MSGVILKRIGKTFPGGVKAVSGFDIEIPDGEFLILVGPSGCGKSTTLRMIAGLEEITEGELYIGDRLVNDVAPKDRDIAMVFQNYALYPHMNVYDNMAFGLKLRKVPRKVIDKKVWEAAEILGIGDLLDRRPKALSGGQRQRVALGRAIVRDAGVFLMDEPLSNLDAKLRVQMRAELSKLHQRLKTTFIYVTHDQIEAMTMGNRIVVMKDGIIQQTDTLRNVYNAPANVFVAGFIGTPPMNLFEGLLSNKRDSVEADNANMSIPIPKEVCSGISPEASGERVVVGIRPEDIHISSLSAGNARHCFECHVDVVEPMGPETIIYLSKGEIPLTAKVPADHPAKPGDLIQVCFNLNKLHLFLKQTGNRIF